MSHQSVYAIAVSEDQVNQIVDNLTTSWFFSNDISVLYPDKGPAHEVSTGNHPKTPNGVVSGPVIGGILGGTFGLLAGIGALVIPGVGPLIAAGPMLAALTIAAAGATVGKITGGLIGIGIPEIEAKRYENRMAEGNILISVLAESGDDVSRAEEVLQNSGAEDISVTSIREVTAPQADPLGSFHVESQNHPVRRGLYAPCRMILSSMVQSRIGIAMAGLSSGDYGLGQPRFKK